VRFATFNILNGRSLDDELVDVDRFAGAIESLDADVLALQEVDRDQPRSLGTDLTAVAARAMGAVAHHFVAALTGVPGVTWEAATGEEQPGTAAYGIALLSRYPVEGWQVLRLPPLRVPVPRRFGSGRPQLIRDEARVAVLAEVQTPDGPLLVAATHLSFLPGWNVVQLRRVRQVMAAQPGPAVLMGDLNMEPRLAQRTTRLRPLAAAATFPVDEPRRQIDHILGRGVGVDGTGEAVRLPLSDHRALVVGISGLDR
jgi:endonuclease/exonuclease/phosphatase family metal-dependent hydrolase